MTINVSIPESVQRNKSSLFAHVFVCRKGYSPNPSWAKQHRQRTGDLHWNTMYAGVELTHRLPEKQVLKAIKRNLLYDPVPPPEDLSMKKRSRILPYWAPRLAIFVVTDELVYPALDQNYMNEIVLWHLQQQNAIDHQQSTYKPLLYIDELGTLSKDMLDINSTATVLPLKISLAPLGTTRFHWMVQMYYSIQMHKEMGTPESEMEDVRRMFVETNSWLLVVTITVSLLHVILDLLAFKNDVYFWRDLQSTKGISVRAIAVEFVMEFVVLLYLFDNDTSYLVLFTVFGTLVVDLWKLVRAWALMRGHQAGDDQDSKQISEEEAVSRQIDYLASMVGSWTRSSLATPDILHICVSAHTTPPHLCATVWLRCKAFTLRMVWLMPQ